MQMWEQTWARRFWLRFLPAPGLACDKIKPTALASAYPWRPRKCNRSMPCVRNLHGWLQKDGP